MDSKPDLHLKLVDRVDGGLIVFTDGSRILFPGEGIYFGPDERDEAAGVQTMIDAMRALNRADDARIAAFERGMWPNLPA